MQGPDGSSTARCGSLGVPGLVDGRHLVAAPGSQQDGQAGHQRAEQKAAWPDTWQSAGRPDEPPAGRAEGHGLVLGNGRIAPGRCAAAPWASLAGWMGGHLVITAPGGQEDGQAGHQQAGRLPDAGQLRRGAVRLLGRLWPRG